MKACLLRAPAPIESNPLDFCDVPAPQPAFGEVLVRVQLLRRLPHGSARVEGELPPRKSPIIPGHQVVGTVEAHGEGATLPQGARVGVAWLHHTDGTCQYCRAGQENLCDHPDLHRIHGGRRIRRVHRGAARFRLRDSRRFADQQAAPLLCAGIIGFRSPAPFRHRAGGRLGFYGFGAAAHVAIQVARHWRVEVYASTRDVRHQRLAARTRRGVGRRHARRAARRNSTPPSSSRPPARLSPPRCKALRKGGVLVLGGIHMSPIPSFDYDLLYGERVIRSVANNTRRDGEDFLAWPRKYRFAPTCRSSRSQRRQSRAQLPQERRHRGRRGADDRP